MKICCIYGRAGMIMKILLIIDFKSVISIMLIIPKDILFKHETANNVQYGSDRKPFCNTRKPTLQTKLINAHFHILISDTHTPLQYGSS